MNPLSAMFQHDSQYYGTAIDATAWNRLLPSVRLFPLINVVHYKQDLTYFLLENISKDIGAMKKDLALLLHGHGDGEVDQVPEADESSRRARDTIPSGVHVCQEFSSTFLSRNLT
jgi:hypothetical protein